MKTFLFSYSYNSPFASHPFHVIFPVPRRPVKRVFFSGFYPCKFSAVVSFLHCFVVLYNMKSREGKCFKWWYRKRKRGKFVFVGWLISSMVDSKRKRAWKFCSTRDSLPCFIHLFNFFINRQWEEDAVLGVLIYLLIPLCCVELCNADFFCKEKKGEVALFVKFHLIQLKIKK